MAGDYIHGVTAWPTGLCTTPTHEGGEGGGSGKELCVYCFVSY